MTSAVGESSIAGFVYFVKMHAPEGPIKIGWAITPAERIATLQTASPWRLELLAALEGDKRFERQLHRELRVYRIRGEWFKDCQQVRAAMQTGGQGGFRPLTLCGERCGNCSALLVHGEDDGLCKACIEFAADRESGRDPFASLS